MLLAAHTACMAAVNLNYTVTTLSSPARLSFLKMKTVSHLLGIPRCRQSAWHFMGVLVFFLDSDEAVLGELEPSSIHQLSSSQWLGAHQLQ